VALGATGCRVNQDDLHRWENTQRGPEKLQAVLLHDKYELPLRIEAALSLIRMKPRSGRFVGIDILAETLAAVPNEERDKILDGVVPVMIGELKKDPPAAQAGQPAPPDPSFAYKDAAYLLFTYEKQVLVTDAKARDKLREALIEWAVKDFDRRLENRQQKYGMEQLLRFLGQDGVKQLPEKITRESRNQEKIANLIDELGTPETKEAASAKFVEIAKWIMSQEWLDMTKPRLEEANKTSKKYPDAAQFKAQLESYQDEELQRVLGSLKKIGGRAAVEFLLTLAADKSMKEDRRVWALSALELRLDPKNAKDIERIFAIAMDSDPKTATPKVLDMAFLRIGELERDVVIAKLYEAFKTDKWKVRRAAGSLILRMSEMKHLEEFMSKLPEKDAKGFASNEAANYGDQFIDLKNGDIRKELDKYLAPEKPIAQRTTALGFYLTQGTPDDLKKLEPFKADKAALPSCEGAEEGCKWECYVAKDEKKPDDNKELKEVKTFGEYVSFCAEPFIKQRAAEKAKKEKK